MPGYLYSDLTSRIIGSAIQVQKSLGTAYDDKIIVELKKTDELKFRFDPKFWKT